MHYLWAAHLEVTNFPPQSIYLDPEKFLASCMAGTDTLLLNSLAPPPAWLDMLSLLIFFFLPLKLGEIWYGYGLHIAGSEDGDLDDNVDDDLVTMMVMWCWRWWLMLVMVIWWWWWWYDVGDLMLVIWCWWSDVGDLYWWWWFDAGDGDLMLVMVIWCWWWWFDVGEGGDGGDGSHVGHVYQ